MKKEPLDIKFIVGTVILVAVLVLMGSFFWRTVADQAAIVKEEEAREEAAARHAIYMYYGKYFKKGIFVDMDTEELFSCSVPKNGIYNKNGTLIAGDVLEEGDKVTKGQKLHFTHWADVVDSGHTDQDGNKL